MSDTPTRATAGNPPRRMVPPTLYDFTFQDTGISVKIAKQSPHIGAELRKAFPPPKPPKQLVEFADGTKRDEANESDPDYQREMEDYNLMLEAKMRSVLIKRGVICDVDTEAVKELRAQMDAIGVTLDADDKVVYITHICVGSEDGYNELVAALTQRAQPTDAAVNEAAADLKS